MLFGTDHQHHHHHQQQKSLANLRDRGKGAGFCCGTSLAARFLREKMIGGSQESNSGSWD